MPRRRCVLTALLGLSLVAAACKPATPGEETGEKAGERSGDEPSAKPSGKISRAALDESLALGTDFLINNQRPAGNFNYEYDWRKKQQTKGDSQVRQAGAAWGLALIYEDSPSARVGEPLRKAVGFFALNSREQGGRRFIVYPGDKEGSTGTVALVTLALIEILRTEGRPQAEMPAAAMSVFREHLEQQLSFLVSARDDEGMFHASYDLETGTPAGDHSPYFDGESLLALVKAAKYLGRAELWPLILESADRGWQVNVVEARARDNDSKITKGYYQWSSMAFFEIATSDQPGVERFGDRVIELADWMIDVHRTLKRTRNTAYAYEGIIHAYEIARRRGDKAHEEKFAKVIRAGMTKLTSWQLGSSIGNGFVAQHDPEDKLARGGVQNHAKQAPLRIDVTQHQMHAVILARRYVYLAGGR